MISVVIPLYNASEYICEAFDSALMQEEGCEIIVVDDCSTDTSLKTLCSHIKKLKPEGIEFFDCKDASLIYSGEIKDKPVLVVKNFERLGVAHTRNVGVKLANGEYIAFLDADDIWDKRKLSKQMKLMERTKAPLVCTSRRIADKRGRLTGRVIHSPKVIDLRTLKRSNYVNCSSVLTKKEILLDIPMEHGEAHEDYLAWLRICEKYGTFYCLDEPLMTYRLSKKGKSRNKLKSAVMTYKTYVLFGCSKLKAFFMMFSYVFCGLKKY